MENSVQMKALCFQSVYKTLLLFVMVALFKKASKHATRKVSKI